MGVNSSQIVTRNNLLNNLGYRVSNSNRTNQCVTGEFLDNLNPKPNITTDNYSSNKTYSNFTTAEILDTTIVEKKYINPNVVPVTNKFTLNTSFDAEKFKNTCVWSIDISKLGAKTDISISGISMDFYLTGTTLTPALSNEFNIEVMANFVTTSWWPLSSREGVVKIPTSSAPIITSITLNSTELENMHLTGGYISGATYDDFNGVTRGMGPNTAYIYITISVYVYDSNGEREYINIPSNLKVIFKDAPVITARCKSKLVTFNTLKTCKAVLPFRFGLHSNGVSNLSVDNMYLYGHVPTDDGSSFTKTTLASHTGLSNTGNGDYKKYLDYIVINPSGTLTPEKFIDSSSYASFSAGTTLSKRHWYVYTVNGTATDFNKVVSQDISSVTEATDAKSINKKLGDPAIDLVKVIRDHWGVMLSVMS